MLAQNQLNASALLLFSPCFLRYMSQSCPGSSTNAFCTAGALGNMTTITGTIQMTTLPTATGVNYLPNLYESGQNATSLLTFMGTLIGTMAATGITLSDFGLNQNVPFPMVIVNYTYFTGSPALGFTAGLTGPGWIQFLLYNSFDRSKFRVLCTGWG